MSARDFFYDNYTTSSRNSRYADNYQNLSEQQKKELEHSVRWSNDTLIESYMRDLFSVAPSEFQSRIEQCFVGKLRDFTANAIALKAEDGYYGDLIFFNVGLSDACFQYAILFVEILKAVKMEASVEHIDDILIPVAINIGKIAAAQNRWNSIRQVALAPWDNLSPNEEDTAMAVAIAVTADKFVLYHEVCHHILGHTSSCGNNFIDELPEACKAWLRPINDAHKREFQADAGALLLALWSAKKDSRSAEITASLGAMLFFTTIGQFATDAWKPSDSHPSEGERFRQCCNTLAHLLPEDSDFGYILSDILRFQDILYKSQGRGIGSKFFST